jgi:hypothetical protein
MIRVSSSARQLRKGLQHSQADRPEMEPYAHCSCPGERSRSVCILAQESCFEMKHGTAESAIASTEHLGRWLVTPAKPAHMQGSNILTVTRHVLKCDRNGLEVRDFRQLKEY